MHRNLIFIGSEATDIHFELLNKRPTGNGFYKYNLRLEDEVEFAGVSDSDDEFMLIYAKCGVDGFLGKESDEDPERVFSVSVRMFLRFKLDGIKQEQFTEKEMQNSNWYFNNLAHLEGKKIVESILDNTMLKGTVIPADPKGYRS